MKYVIVLFFGVFCFVSCADYLLDKGRDDTPEFGTFTDSRDGFEYKTVSLGDQTWMAENLRFLPAVSQLAEGSSTDKHYYVYDYDGSDVESAKATDNYKVYGALYNWEAAQSACPAGWYLPSDDDFKTLEFVLGMPPVEAENIEWRYGGEVGTKLKSKTLWYSDLGGDNSSGFNVLPAGFRTSVPAYTDILKFADFWTSTSNDEDQVFFRALRYSLEGIFRSPTYSRDNGFSIRCLQEPF